MIKTPIKLEVCIDSPDGLRACQSGVDTIELCSALALGGLTPSAGVIALAQNSTVPIHAMIRPRGGDFVYSAEEIDVMLADISVCNAASLAGVVLGASTHDGVLDLSALRLMVKAASGLQRTLHRVIDTLADPILAMEQAIDLGFSRILTSGGHPRAQDGTGNLKKLVQAAGDRIEIIVGSGVSAANIVQLAQNTGARSFHASCSRPVVQSAVSEQFGFAPADMRTTDPETIASLRRRLTSLG